MLRELLLIASIPSMILGSHAQLSIQLIPVATGLPNLVDIAHAGDDRIFCALQTGTIRIVQNGTVLPTPFLNITSQVVSSGERGLLGLAFDPNYETNGWFYIHYTAPSQYGTSIVSRFTVSSANPNVADATSEQILFTFPQPASNHNGGEIDFGPDGYLYIGLGDGGGAGDIPNNAQTLSNPLGAILRIDVSAGDTSYDIPPTNPFVNAVSDTLPEIWAYGLRNPWRFGFDALNGDLWVGDVGQNAWEEMDHWPNDENYNTGPNFGWRCREGFVPYNMSGCGPLDLYVEPLAVHSTVGAWCSIIGGRVYRGVQFPSLYGHFIYGDYCSQQFWSLYPDGSGGWENTQLATGQGQGFTVIAEDSQLELYAGNKSNGTLYRIVDPLTVGMPVQDGPMFNVYPVPAGERLVIEGELNEVIGVQLFDQAGRMVAERSLNGVSTRADLDVSSLSNGIYVLVLKGGQGMEAGRRLVSVMH